jgi:hypothetical protein
VIEVSVVRSSGILRRSILPDPNNCLLQHLIYDAGAGVVPSIWWLHHEVDNWEIAVRFLAGTPISLAHSVTQPPAPWTLGLLTAEVKRAVFACSEAGWLAGICPEGLITGLLWKTVVQLADPEMWSRDLYRTKQECHPLDPGVRWRLGQDPGRSGGHEMSPLI